MLIEKRTLSYFGEVSFSPQAQNTDMARRLVSLLDEGGYHVVQTPSGELVYREDNQEHKTRERLLITTRRGVFLKNCPGTPRYLCCGYRVLAWAEGCPLACDYCVLAGYFKGKRTVLFTNIQAIIDEISNWISAGRPFIRLGTGEFTDSLFLEPLAKIHYDLVPLVARSDNIVLEIKTKTDWIEPILDLDHRRRTIISWSLNSTEIADMLENNLPSIESRLKAAVLAASAGYQTAFHFDPLIYYPGWEEGYRRTIEMMADLLPAKPPVWISLGCLRFPEPMFRDMISIKKKGFLTAEELHQADDGKMRYLRPVRVNIYRHMAKLIGRIFPGTTVYLCMENGDVWEDSLGIVPSSSGDVSRILDGVALRSITT